MASGKVNKGRLQKFIITTGDPDGIGEEVTYKALLRLKSRRKQIFFVFIGCNHNHLIKKLRRHFIVKLGAKIFASFDEALSECAPSCRVRLIESPLAPPFWVEAAARACLEKKVDGLITAPLSKTLILDSGLVDIGHTEILSRICRIPKSRVRMAFIGRHFNVVLATGHIPLKEVAASLSAEAILDTLRLASQMRKSLPRKIGSRPLALVGLNPHASDHGLIGTEEGSLFNHALELAATEKIDVLGPLVPDAAFLPNNWPRFSFYICPYHDQGLIPFKAIHGQTSGVHVTLGLPILRTSVDHGTAKDLFGKNTADPGSMVEAIEFAIKMGESNGLSTRHLS